MFIDVVAMQVIAENVQKITCLKKVLCKGTIFLFKCRWLCQCRYFENGKLTQSCWDEKLWNYIAFIVSASIFFLNVARGGRKKLKCFFKKINGGVESLTTVKIVGRADGWGGSCSFLGSQEKRASNFSHTLCSKSFILCIYQNYTLRTFEKMSFTHFSHNFWLTVSYVFALQKSKQKSCKVKGLYTGTIDIFSSIKTG